LAAAVVVFILALVGLFIYLRATEEMSGLSQELASKLDRERVASFELADATEEQAVERLNQVFKQSKQFKDIHVEIWKGKTPPKGFHGLFKDSGENDSSIPKITLKFPSNVNPRMPGVPEANPENNSDVSLRDLLFYVRNLSGTSVGQKGNTLYFINGLGEFGPLVEHTFRMFPGYFESRGKTQAQTIAQFLRTQGIGFEEGTAEFISPDRLRIRCRQTDMDVFETMFCDHEPTWFESAKWWCLAQWEKVKTFMGLP
jgi:hypothetical protein